MKTESNMTSVAALQAKIGAWVEQPVRQDVLDRVGSHEEWVVSARMADLLTRLVEDLRPQRILEFGAGRSSLALAAALQTAGGGRLTSVEHEPAYSAEAWKGIVQFDKVDARMLTSPLGLRLSRRGLLHEYVQIDRELKDRGPYDFVFIDAPPGYMGRDTALLVAMPWLIAGAIVVLDDAARQAEKTAVSRWERVIPLVRVYESDSVARGTSVLMVTKPGTPRFHWRNFVGSLHDRWLERRHGKPPRD